MPGCPRPAARYERHNDSPGCTQPGGGAVSQLPHHGAYRKSEHFLAALIEIFERRRGQL